MDTIKNTPRDTFMYLLAIITLVASAVSFGILVYNFIDIRFPDVLRGGYGYVSGNLNSIRNSLAALVVVFPIFIWVTRTLRKEVVAHPEKRELKVRRWLLYLTVFVASLVVIGDLVTLINNFLQGDLTMPFILKVLTILFIAGSSLFYYLSELQDRDYPRKAFQWTIVGIVIAAVVYGFYTAGSPQSQRLVRLDDQKTSHLQMIQNQIQYYWQQKGSLPVNLATLNDPLSGFAVPLDPQSGQEYEYHATGPRSFQLCADYNKPNSDTGASSIPVIYPGGANDYWQHAAGHTCFDRTIDPALYPVKPPVK